MSQFSRTVTVLSRACGVVAAAALVLACLVVCEMVFVRYVLEASTIWQTEFVLYSVVASTLIGSPYVLSVGGHVKVDLVSQFLAPRARRILNVIASTMGFIFCLVLAWSGGRYFYEALIEGWVTESVWAPPLWILLLPLPIGIGLLCLQYCAQIGEILGGSAASDAPSEMGDDA